jgi:phage anti-repressor protein
MKHKSAVRANPQNREVVPRHCVAPVDASGIGLKRIGRRVADKLSLVLDEKHSYLDGFTNSMSDEFKVLVGDFGVFKASFSCGEEGAPKKFIVTMNCGKKVLYVCMDMKNESTKT